MIDYLVDASVFSSRVVYDVHTDATRVLFDQAEADIHRLYIPAFGITEVINVIWKQVRFHNTTIQDGQLLIDALLELRFEVLPTEGIYKEALQVGVRHQLAIYDSLYIAVAKR